jgi:hypothetical protein
MGRGSRKAKDLRLGQLPPKREPAVGDIPPRRKFTFSMRYWSQFAYFGLDNQQKGWFVSLLERLRVVCGLDISDLQDQSAGVADAIRFHEINWKQRNCPIRLRDLDWIPDNIKLGPEFVLQQLHVSKSLGRIIGFLDEHNVFQIVLLDPLHNMQPTKDFNYRVRHTNISDCDFTFLVSRIRRIVTNKLDAETRDAVLKSLNDAVDERVGHALVVDISGDLLDALLELEFGEHCAGAEDVLNFGVSEVKKMLAK